MNGRVLIVEDDPSIRQLVRAVLEGRGYDVSEVEDGLAAVPAAREKQPDVILLDVGLPGMDGFGVLGQLKDDDDLRSIPVVMVTAWAEPALVAKALDRGAHDYIRKPFDISDLGARVDAAARVKAATDFLAQDNDRLASLATIDGLTGLPNRLQLTTELERQVAAGRRGNPFSLVMVDLDRFSLLNEVYGHTAGDHALRALSRRLGQRVRGCDVLGRWGGEEFLIVAPDTELDGACVLAEDLRVALDERPLDTPGASLRVTASFGVAEHVEGESYEQVLARADAALYDAKAGGRNAVVAADDSMIIA